VYFVSGTAQVELKVDKCKPLAVGQPHRVPDAAGQEATGRGLHSSTFQLNLSALYGIGGARRGRVAREKGC